MRLQTKLIAGATLALAASVLADGVDPAINNLALIGINRSTGDMHRFSFQDLSLKNIGKVKTKNGTVLTGIDASAYIQGNMNVWTFWTDPADGLIKLMYVNALTGEAVQVGQDLGTGHAGGAVAAQVTDGNGVKRWVNFVALQAKHVDSTDLKVAGKVNINPNNSTQNEFTVDKPLGTTMLGSLAKFTRDELHKNTSTQADGTYYSGPATSVLVKPKGNGNQNGLTINGQVFEVNNNTTYVFTGDLTIRVYNDLIQNNKAMGHWWIDITANAGAVTVDGQVQTSVTDVHRIVRVDHRTGAIEHSMSLSRLYEGLTTLDGVNFYAAAGNKLYLLNVSNESETLVGNMSKNDVKGLEFAGTTLMAFDAASDTLQPVNPANATNAANAANLGIPDLGTFIFINLSDDPEDKVTSYD